MTTIHSFISLLIGLLLSYLFLYLIFRSKTVKKTSFDSLQTQFNNTVTELKVQEDRLRNMSDQNQSLLTKLQEAEAAVGTAKTTLVTASAHVLNAEAKAAELAAITNALKAENQAKQTELNTQAQKLAELNANLCNTRDQLHTANGMIDKLTGQTEKQNKEINELVQEKSRLAANNNALQERLALQKEEMESLQQKAHLQFEKLANQIFEEKSTRFTETNKANIESLLNPLKEDIGKFKTKVEETYDKESKERFSLENRVKDLIEQTNKVSNEANNLATALKGHTKKQGDWGEMILERILETSGLTKDREYFLQETIKDEEGRSLRPDVLVHLPDNRIIIIDSKVSLIAYDRYVSAGTPEEQQVSLSNHLKSVYGHIDALQSRKYDNHQQALDFTMMFIPIEPAYLLSIQNDQELWSYAYARRILLISPTNLIACLKLISDLWNREKQSRNAMEIVQRGERLYEKIVAFANSMEDIGKNLNRAQSAYTAAFDQLKTGRGNMMSQAMQLRALGLKSSKSIPASMTPVDPNEDETEMPD